MRSRLDVPFSLRLVVTRRTGSSRSLPTRSRSKRCCSPARCSLASPRSVPTLVRGTRAFSDGVLTQEPSPLSFNPRRVFPKNRLCPLCPGCAVLPV
eukprot:6134586-Pleurochrysis_carterae.AAC.2